MLTLPLFFFNDTATTEIYPLSLHDALPISSTRSPASGPQRDQARRSRSTDPAGGRRSEEHTSELQSQSNLVCRLLLEKTKQKMSALTPDASSIPLRALAGCVRYQL